MRILLTLTILGALAASVAAQDIVVDNDDGAPGYVESGQAWKPSVSPGYNDGTYVYLSNNDPVGTATWRPDLPSAGIYEVFAILRTSDNRPNEAVYTIEHALGTSRVTISQNGPNAVREISLGNFAFDAGTAGSVSLTNRVAAGSYIADAVRFAVSVDKPPTVSGVAQSPTFPRPDSTVTVSANVRDDAGLASVELVYTIDGGTDSTVGMTNTTGDVYTADIPAQPLDVVVRYRVGAIDSADMATESAEGSYTVREGALPEFRSIWADSWNRSFRTTEEADEMIATCREYNFNTVMVEVRKIGDAYYDSSIEPRATNIPDPSFDPLQYIIDIAHDTSGGKQRIQVHAWFVMHRISTSTNFPAGHVLSEHPEYMMLDSDGLTNSGGTVFLDPGHPGTVEHNVAVIMDCVSRYDIDGVNLDYIRYPEAAGAWGYNPTSVARFNAFAGRTGQPAGNDQAWQDWRRENVTQEVRKIYVNLAKLKPNVVLTADTINWGFAYNNFPVSSAYNEVYQDWQGWLREGILDYNSLMNYSNQVTYPGRFEGWTNASLSADGIRGSIIGNGAYLQPSIDYSIFQFLYARAQGADGFNVYDWGSEVSMDEEGATRADFYRRMKDEVTTEWADPPQPAWKTKPTKGIVEGTFMCDGTPMDHAVVTIDGSSSSVHTDGMGWYGIVEAEPGPRTVRFSRPGQADLVRYVNVEAGVVTTMDADCDKGNLLPDLWIIE